LRPRRVKLLIYLPHADPSYAITEFHFLMMDEFYILFEVCLYVLLINPSKTLLCFQTKINLFS
jgi:hypothetical protein